MPDADPSAKDIVACIDLLLGQRVPGKTICPSEVARALSDDWRPLMPAVRLVARDLAVSGKLRVTQKGQPVDALSARGPIRLGLPER